MGNFYTKNKNWYLWLYFVQQQKQNTKQTGWVTYCLVNVVDKEINKEISNISINKVHRQVTKEIGKSYRNANSK